MSRPRLSPPDCGHDLRKISILKDLEAGSLDQLFAQLRVREVAAGQIISAGGGDDEMVAFVWHGAIRVTLMSPHGLHVNLRYIRRGGHFGEISAFSRTPQRHYQVLVDETAMLLEMPSSAFIELLRRDQKLCAAVLEALARTAVVRADRIFEFATLNTRLRLLAELLRMAQKEDIRENQVVIRGAPTHDAIAAQVGTTREGVTRALKNLAGQGLVRARRGEIVILNLERLRGIVEAAAGRRATYESDLGDAA